MKFVNGPLYYPGYILQLYSRVRVSLIHSFIHSFIQEFT